MSGYQAPRCECGHAVGEHKSGGTRWPHPPSYGLCFVSNCECREFVEREPVAVQTSETHHVSSPLDKGDESV